MAGLAEYLDIDVMALRVGFVAASLFLLGGVGGPVLYLLAWAIVPEEGKAASLAAETMEAKPWQHWACRCGGRPNQAAGGTN
jgi:phage shock protein PspC (stress-responsive transcriptional regulator)